MAGSTSFPVALSIAGSDSGGGAGIQADLRVMHRIGVFGTTAITALTAQNLDGVSDVEGVRPSLLGAQIDAVLQGFDVRAIKTGMLWSNELIDVVADRLKTTKVPLVIDPVMVATSGARLLDEAATDGYRRLLFPIATLVTPNLDEAEVLLERSIDRAKLEDEARALRDALQASVLLKGGHLDGPPVDVLCTETTTRAFRHERIEGANTHGSGCMLSAAIAAYLALGCELEPSVERGLTFTHQALLGGANGAPPHLAHIEQATLPTHTSER